MKPDDPIPPSSRRRPSSSCPSWARPSPRRLSWPHPCPQSPSWTPSLSAASFLPPFLPFPLPLVSGSGAVSLVAASGVGALFCTCGGSTMWNSTRRLAARPALVLLCAIGRVGPKPCASSRPFHAVLDQELHDAARAPVGQLHVVLGLAAVVGVTLDGDLLDGGRRHQRVGHRLEHREALRGRITSLSVAKNTGFMMTICPFDPRPGPGSRSSWDRGSGAPGLSGQASTLSGI